MKLTENNWMVLLIRSTFGLNKITKCPKTLCTFFWSFILSLVLFPIAIYSHIWNFISFKRNKGFNSYTDISNVFYGFLMLFLFMAIGIGFLEQIQAFKEWFFIVFDKVGDGGILSAFATIYSVSFIGLVVGAIFLAIIIAIIFFIVYVVEGIREKRNKKEHILSREEYIEPKKRNIFFEFLKAKKQKVCPLIEYVEE